MSDHDAFDLPTKQQSGNVDIGHISENVESEESRLRGEQGEGLTNLLNDYYAGDIDGNALYSGLTDLGYSDDRVEDLYSAGQTERTFRSQNNQPTGLSVNQLNYLSTRTNFDITRTTIHTDENGRVYVDDYRTREEGGEPAKLYLPEPETFDPLTQTQRAQIDLDETYLSYITLEEPQGTGEILQDNIDLRTRHQVSQLLAQYFVRSNEPGNDQRRTQLYRDIQELSGLQNQRNIRPKLLQLFNDIDREQQYRVDNDGRPQGLTDEQWNNLQDSPFYYGQPILTTDTIPPINYIVSGQRYIEINDVGIASGRASDQRPLDYDNLPGDTKNQLNLLSTEFLTNRQEDPQIFTENILNTINYDADSPNDVMLRLQTEDLVNTLNQERIFRSQNNGRPSDISELQYEFMLNHALSPGEPRYTGEPLISKTLPDRSIGYGFYSWDSNIPDLILIPGETQIRQMIDAGVYTRPQQQQEPTIPDTDPDDNLQPPRRPQIPPEGLPPLPTIPTADPSLAPPPDSEIRPSISGAGEPHLRPLPAGGEAPPGLEPPVVPGITQPINIRTGEDIPADSLERNVLRYQRFFNDNQSLYYGFREAFRDILPVLSAGAGGYMTYLYEASKQKTTIQTIINQETQLLNEIQGRIDSARLNINSILNKPVDITPRAGELSQDLYEARLEDLDLGDFFYTKMEDIPEALERARTAIEEERATLPPERAFALRGTYEYQFNEPERFILSQKVEQLDFIETLIEDQRETIETLQTEIQDSNVYTRRIDNNLQQLQNRNYEILANIQSSAPKILMGLNIGYTLGLVLSGYLYPTYMNINEPYESADNIEYTKNNINLQHIKKRNKLEAEEHKDEEIEIPPTIKREYDAPPSKIVKPFELSFKPVKHGKRPLKYNEIQELKATLNQSELNNLKNKYLYFDDDRLKMEKSADKCRNVVGEIQITKRKVF